MVGQGLSEGPKGKLKIDMTNLKGKRNAEFRKLGLKVFHLVEEERYEIPEAAENLEAIGKLTEKIRGIEKQYEAAGQKPEGEIDHNEQQFRFSSRHAGALLNRYIAEVSLPVTQYDPTHSSKNLSKILVD